MFLAPELRRYPRFRTGSESWVSFTFEGARYSGLPMRNLSVDGVLVALPLGLKDRIRPMQVIENIVLAHPGLAALPLQGVVIQACPQDMGVQFLGLPEEMYRSLAAKTRLVSPPCQGEDPAGG